MPRAKSSGKKAVEKKQVEDTQTLKFTTISSTAEKLEFTVENIEAPFANALRRTMIDEV